MPASVFDDDFFRAPAGTPRAEERGSGLGPAVRRAWVSEDVSGGRRVQQEESARGEVFHVQAAESAVRPAGSSFEAAAEGTGQDELDIPAFLRRGH